MSIGNELVLENAIVQHAYDLFGTEVIKEYRYQIIEWQKYINQVVDAEREALKNHQNTLKEVINAEKEAKQAGAMYAMLALSLLSGPALSWIGGTIQYKLYPALRSEPRLAHTYFYMEKRKNRAKSVRMEYTAEEHNKVAAKIFGDASVNITQLVGVDYLANKIQTKARENGNSFDQVASLSMIPQNAKSDTLYQSLKTNFENALADEQLKTEMTISDFALELKANPRLGPNFGKAVLEKMYREQPNTKQESQALRQQRAYQAVIKIVDAFRNKWADDWFYYGNNPPRVSTYEMSRKIEREIWAMWLLDQAFKTVVYSEVSFQGEVESEIEYEQLEGRDQIPLATPILNRLIELGVVFPQTATQLKQLNDRNLGKPKKEKPDVFISKSIDTPQELIELENWAKNHPIELLSGVFDSEIRMLPSVIDIHK